ENFILCAIGVGNFHLLGQNFSSYMQIRGLKVPSVRGKNFNLCANRQGETHDSPEDHQAQLEILQALYREKQKNAKDGTAPRLVIAMEMFQRPYQNILDQYIAGKITEEQFIEQSEYEERWGFAWEYYAPILRFARTHQLPVLALNTPTEVTRKVARSGLESLTAAERRYIPPFSEIRTDNAEYRQMIQTSYEQHDQGGHGNSSSFERFFTAQVLWDETMAEAIAQWLKANPDDQVIVLAGQAHIVYGYGIPSRVARRLNNHQLVQRSVLFGVPQKEPSRARKSIADYFWAH
ncbi:MAG TPA: ChaN family lipoprotein, partial [Stenomitos sp.]